MHFEKNVCNNLLGTLLNLEEKSKDNLKAWKDLQAMKLRPELHPILLPNGKYELPNAPYTLSSEEKTRLLHVLKHLRVQDEYANNMSGCVNLKEHKLLNLKSHNCHILMQSFLLIKLRAAKEQWSCRYYFGSIDIYEGVVCERAHYWEARWTWS